jgi:hypothetical protein
MWYAKEVVWMQIIYNVTQVHEANIIGVMHIGRLKQMLQFLTYFIVVNHMKIKYKYYPVN